MPRSVVRRPWWPLLPLLALGAEDPAPSKLSFFGSSKDAEPAAPSKLSFFGGGSSAKEAAAAEPAAPSKMSFFGSASAGDARRQEDGQDSKRAAAAAADAPKRPFFGSSSAKQAREQEEPVLSDLQPEAEQEDEEVPSIFDSVNHPPPGFHRDPAGSTVAAGHHHTCALRQSSAPFGGIAHCWGEDTMGAVSRVPVELTFIQLSSGHFHSCGITLDEKLVCWGGPNPKRFEPPGLYQQVSCGAVHTCGLRKDGQVKCWFLVRRPFFLPSYASRRWRAGGGETPYAIDARATLTTAQGRGPRHGLHEAARRKVRAGPGGQRVFLWVAAFRVGGMLGE